MSVLVVCASLQVCVSVSVSVSVSVCVILKWKLVVDSVSELLLVTILLFLYSFLYSICIYYLSLYFILAGDDDAEEEAQWQFQLGQSEPEIDEDAYYNRDPKKALNHYFEEEGCL